MEALAEQPQTSETQRSFDPLASVRLLRYDFERFNKVLPETRQRVCDEELSYLVEGIDKAACTSFVIKRDGENLVYFSEGAWRPYIGTLLKGWETARDEAEQDPRRMFLADRAREDLVQGYGMLKLRPGEQMIWHSPYAHQEESLFGKEFMKDCGMIPERKMGFLYLATCQDDGGVLLQSHTVDRSDEGAFAAVYQAVELTPCLDMGAMVAAYDEHLQDKHGGNFFAGRLESEKNENAWDEIHRHRDLIEFHLNKLEEIASRAISGAALEDAAKRHLYGVWAAFKKRLNGESVSPASSERQYVSHLYDPMLNRLLEAEVHQSFREFVSRGEVLVGCGGAIRILQGEKDIMSANAADVHSAIFNGPDSDEYGSRTFICPAGHRNRRPWGTLLKRCKEPKCAAKVTC